MTGLPSLFLYRDPPEPRSLETILTDAQDARERSEALRADATRLLLDSRRLRADAERLRKAAPPAA